MSMKNVNVTLDTICALSRISSTNMDMKESVFNVIKNDILSHEINNLIYFAIPMWSYSKGTWNKDIPVFYANKDYCELYKKFFVCLKELDFSFVDFISTKLKTIPLYVDIEYVDGPLTDYCNSVDLDRISIFFSKSSIINLKVEDILSIQETDAEFKKFSFRLLDHIVNSDVNVALKLYKFLAIYTIYFKTDLKYITIINSILYKPTSTSKDIGYGGAIVVLKKELSEMAKRLISIVLNIKHKEIAISDWIEKNTIDLQKESIKSAKAAIMSRNMSHNLGSHVMFYIKQKLQSVSKIVDNKVLDNIIPGTLSNIPEIVAKIKENKDIELPFLVGLGRFINYLQERQDYIATIATDYIPANSTISFKDFVYDELKPELRYQRHHSNSDDAGWKSGNLLLDYIAYSEGYRSCDDIEILFGDFNGNTPVKDSNPDKDFQKLREFNIAVPGGVIGRQALFSIFENIIRNAAKHSERRSDNKLVLQLSLLEKDSDILANLKAKRKKRESEIDGEILKNLYFNNSDKYHFLRIKVDMPNPNGVIDTLVDNLADPYLDDNGVMSETTNGLKEMRISAAWLRGYSIDTAIPSNEPPVISIYSELFNKNDENDKRVTLSYILCIQKPCRVAFVKDEQDREYKTINEVLGLYGCKVFVNPFKLEKQEECDKLINEIANYEIVCMPKHLEEQLRSFVSSRYITDNETTNRLFEDLRKSTDKKVINNLVGSIYEEWFRDAYNGDTPKLVIADGKAVQNKKKADGSLSCDSNVILTTTGMIADEDNASNQKSVSGNNASISETETTVTQEDVRGAVVYSTHFKGLASKSDGPDGYNTWLQNAICIESVTGNNSTARLIRQDEWTKEWKTKILSAGMARVAIFDERIFSSFISRESVLKHDNVSVEEIQNLIAEYKSKEQSDDLILEFCKNMVDKYGINDDDSSNIYYNFSTIEEVIYCLEITYHNDVAQKNHERRIWAFDIRVPEKVNNIVEIIGYNVLIGDSVGAYIERKTDAIITIAKISRHSETGQYNVELCDDKKVFANGNVFDYISIHQGVLDKIYTAFGVKEAAIEKFKVTNALHRCFSKYALNEYNEPVINEEDKIVNKPFLPNFIIHSGRSKPSEKDMPQPQPFVQFAALDHAVKDCKYTLVELLATAHYEKGNNNN